MTESHFYHTNGTLPHDAPSYVERAADRELYAAVARGEYCDVLTSRQVGKSSLMVRTALRLRGAGVTVIVLDLTAMGANLTAEQWYEGLLGLVGVRLDLEDELEQFWLGHERLGPLRRWMQALREIVLARLPGPIVIFIDEIDAVQNLPFSTDEFFAAIRECHNRRVDDPEFHRLTFCLLGVAAPSDLIRNTRTTPFNIGRRVELTDFTEAEAAPLAAGLGCDESTGKTLLKRVLYWTAGHPYLTQRLCQSLAGAVEPRSLSPADVDRACQDLFLSRQARKQDSNLLAVREQLLRSPVDRGGLLELYARIRRGRRVPDDETSPLVNVLRLSGVVRVAGGCLKVRNRIYERVFDPDWVMRHMPDAELRRQRAAYRRGVLRATSVAAIIIAMMTGLVLNAVSNAQRAQAASTDADRRAQEQRTLASRLAETLQELKLTLGVAREARSRANRASTAAQVQARNAEVARQGAEQERRRASAQQQIAIAERGEAFRQREEAMRQRAKVVAQQQVSQQRLVRLQVANGTRLVEEGDLSSSLPWFAEALLLDRGRPAEVIHRMRLLSTLSRCPRLLQVWPLGGEYGRASFSADGLKVVTAGSDLQGQNGRGCVWDVATGRLLARLQQAGAVITADFSRDGRRIVTRNGRGTARVWDAATGAAVTPPLRHAEIIKYAAFSPDGRRVATAGYDRSIRVWDASTGQPLTPPMRHDKALEEVAWSQDGRRLIAAWGTGSVYVWDSATGQRLPLRVPQEGPGHTEFSPDGQRILTSGSHFGSRVWDAQTGRPLTRLMRHRSMIPYATFSPDGRRIVTVSWDHTARVWDAATGEPVALPLQHRANVTRALFSPDSRHVITASDDGTARVWDAATGEPLTPPLQHGNAVRSASFSPDGRRVLTASRDGTARLWSVEPREPDTLTLKHRQGVLRASFSPDGRRILTAESGGEARLWNAGTGQPAVPPLRHGGAIFCASFSLDGHRIVTCSRDGTARVWDAATGRPVTPPLQLRNVVWSAAFSPDGRRVVTGSGPDLGSPGDGEAVVWDAATGARLTPPMRHREAVKEACFSPDGQRILTASWDGTARLWSARTGQPITPPLKHAARLMHATFSRDGRRFVTAGWFTDAVIRDPVTGQRIAPPLPHGSTIECALFSRDSRRIVTASGDQTARVWDAATGRALTPPMRHAGRVTAACFSPDGCLIATAASESDYTSSPSEVRVWDARTGEPITPPLRCAGQVGELSFSPDGARFIAACAGSELPGAAPAARIWTLARPGRPAVELVRRAELLSAHRIDATLGAVVLEPARFLNHWDRLKRERP
jgi:WD40 repeat protein